MNKYDILKKIVSYNMKKIGNGKDKEVIYMVLDDGQYIWNPFMDSTFRSSVDPIDEYGEQQIDKMISEFKSRGDDK